MSSKLATLSRTEFTSDFGWTISLPPGWEKLDDIGSVSLTGCKPVVFSTPSDWSVAITWMRSPRPWPSEVVSKFHKITALDGPVPLEEADAFVKTVFSTAGTVTEARVVNLDNGERGLEIIEFIGTGFQPRCGYQMIVAVPVRDHRVRSAVSGGKSESSYFERLVFYAEAPKFAQMLGSVRQSCTNFKTTAIPTIF